ncbi:MAG: hypothetical protein K9J79_03300 [Desulfobacteraceae bacterium]|nr:hypothetical protein [Desulfobacteraceae bacterium]
MTESQKRPECFGVLELVFPLSENGLRQTPEVCMACGHKTACLKTAIEQGGGLRVEDEKVDRAYQSGKIGFFERWARKKSLHSRKQKNNARDKKS